MYGSPSAPDSHGVVRWKCPPGHLLKFALERSRGACSTNGNDAPRRRVP